MGGEDGWGVCITVCFLNTVIAYDSYDFFIVLYVSLFVIYLCQSPYTIHKLCIVYVNNISLFSKRITVHNTQIMYFYMNKIKIIYLLLSLYCTLQYYT